MICIIPCVKICIIPCVMICIIPCVMIRIIPCELLFYFPIDSHVTPSVIVWVDLWACHGQRSFSGRSRVLCCLLAVTYMGWILLCNQVWKCGWTSEWRVGVMGAP